MDKKIFQRTDILVLVFIIIIGFVLRIYRIDAPLADFHSWRQADTAAVARNMERTGFNILTPTFDDITNLQSGMDNPKGYRFVELPLYNAVFAGLHTALPILSLETWGRIVAI